MPRDELLRFERGKEFHNLGAHTANDRSPYFRIFEDGSTRSPSLTERKEYDKLKDQTNTTGP